MFALEISFDDGVSQPEMIFIRRPQGLIGSSDNAHVVVEDLRALGFQVRLIRDIGRRFRCKPIPLENSNVAPQAFDGSYDGEASLELGNVRLFVTALDFDLLLKDTEPPDRAGVRVLRQSCSYDSPAFPAALVRGNPALVVSFVPDQPIYIGRSKQCALRLDYPDISAKHARMGYESGEFWVEDLGSTNGTFVNQQQISGRVNVQPGIPIIIGREVTIVGVTSHEQLERAAHGTNDVAHRANSHGRKYPVAVSISEVVRPARVVLTPGATVTLGREPGCDMWLGAPHVSRKHCVISMSKTGAISVQDSSTNGTGYERGILKRGEVLPVEERAQVFDFGGGVTVAICFNEEQEREFTTSGGSMWAFTAQKPNGTSPDGSAMQQGMREIQRTLPLPSPNERNPEPWWRQALDYFYELGAGARIAALVVFMLLAVLSGVLINLLYGVLT